MTAPALPWQTCKSLARAAWTRTRALAHPTIEHAAVTAGVDRSHLSRWESERCDHPAPLAVLWSRDLVPDAELDALIELIRADRYDRACDERNAASARTAALSADVARLERGLADVTRERDAAQRLALATARERDQRISELSVVCGERDGLRAQIQAAHRAAGEGVDLAAVLAHCRADADRWRAARNFWAADAVDALTYVLSVRFGWATRGHGLRSEHVESGEQQGVEGVTHGVVSLDPATHCRKAHAE